MAEIKTFLDYYDFKQNFNRRNHPFCLAFVEFIRYASRFAQGQELMAPVCLLRTFKQPIDGLGPLVRIQTCVRAWLARRLVFGLRLDPDVLFAEGLSPTEREIRLKKTGIDLSTARRMPRAFSSRCQA